MRRRFTYQIVEQGYNFTVHAYKYDFDQLWRWAVLLDRFTRAEGNTIGIRYVRLGDNGSIEPDHNVRKVAYPVPELPGVDATNPENVRPVIMIATHDFDATMASLPELLRLLGIPSDAVGRVTELNQAPAPLQWAGPA